MNLFDIIGPVMVGPSSSHTAGAVRLGNVAQAILGETVTKADISLYGSFAETGKGHGTDLALVAGLMGWHTDDLRIPQSFQYAKQIGLAYSFHKMSSSDSSHPNVVKFGLTGDSAQCEVIGSSIGGGRIEINEIDGLPLRFNGEYPALLTMHEDRPGAVSLVTSILSQQGVNIAQMKVFRQAKGGQACMIVETDQPVELSVLHAVAALPLINSVRRIAVIS